MNYSDLSGYIADYAARTDAATVGNVPLFIELSTVMFNHGQLNMKPLRVREMLTTSTLSPVGGVVSLPADYLSFRTITSDEATPRNLTPISPDFSTQQYAGSGSGLSNNFTIVGNSLTLYPSSGTDVTISYYQKIPDLSIGNPSNWLLAKQPSAYLHAGLMQLAIYIRDDKLYERSAAFVADAVEGLNAEDFLANYARAGSSMGMVTP